MAPALRSTAFGSAANVTNASVTVSASGAVTDDLAVFFHSSERGAANSIQPPSGGGWTEQVFIEQGSYNNVGMMWTKPVPSSGTFSVTASSTTQAPIYAHLFILSDAALDAAAGFAITTAAAASAPSVTASGSGELLICHICFGDPRPGVTAPSGMTSPTGNYTVDSSNQGAAASWYQTNVGPGATGTKTPGNAGATTTGVSISAVFKAAAVIRTGDFFPFFGV